ncbi:MAG: hypothetical protein Q9M19_01310 [Mariprofundaceae bacterium]|nr:hypothetical protein [Mariprofundaceae bacterium]
MTKKYVTHEEFIDSLMPINECLLENSKSCQNLTISMMSLFKCIGNMEHSNEFKVCMYDVLQSVERSVEINKELHDQAKNIAHKLKEPGQNG